MRDTLTDVLILLGALIVAAGLAVQSWSLSVVWVGVLLLAAGIARLAKRR